MMAEFGRASFFRTPPMLGNASSQGNLFQGSKPRHKFPWGEPRLQEDAQKTPELRQLHRKENGMGHTVGWSTLPKARRTRGFCESLTKWQRGPLAPHQPPDKGGPVHRDRTRTRGWSRRAGPRASCPLHAGQ